MSPAFYKKQHHIIDASHIREYARATSNDQHDALQLAVDQLTPMDNLDPSPGDVTIVAAHANGVGKELYEPLWDDLHQAAKKTGAFKIRNIWIMDVAWQGESSALNEKMLGDDPSWFDAPRDLFLMINKFRDQMTMPLVGVGHSMGGHNIVTLSMMHPRLFSCLVLIDPVVLRFFSMLGNFGPAFASSRRRDIWPSRDEAAKAFLKNKFYQSWDPRVFDLWIKHGLRELPTALYPENPSSNKLPSPTSKPVTLTTTKHQEVLTFIRSNHPPPGQSMDTYKIDRRTHPDVAATNPIQPFYRFEPIAAFSFLPHLRPRCLYLFPQDSNVCPPIAIKDKLDHTGLGVSGNGGVAGGGTKSILMPKAGHFVPFEKPGDVAAVMESYMADELKRWKEAARLDKQEADALQGTQKFTIGADKLWWARESAKRVMGQNQTPQPGSHSRGSKPKL